ncbi:MAG: glutathione S-transferase family protein [Lysobacterales bacterium]
MPTLYIANKNYSSWSLRPWALMRALNIPFEETIEPLIEGSCWDKYRTFSPNGRVPCLHDGKNVIWESLAIVEYLAESHDGVWPEDKQARAWARCASAEMHAGFSALRNQCTMNCGVRVVLHAIPPELQHDVNRLDELWNEGLERFGGPYLAGESFTAVDAFFTPVAFRVQTYDLALSDTAMAYVRRLLKLDFMREWYAAALKETWREKNHDRELLDAGKIVTDLRAVATG